MPEPIEQTAGAAPSGRKPLTRAEAARHASLVRWGKEQPFAARLAAIRAKKHKGKGKGKKAPKAKLTPEQRDAQRTAKETQQRSVVGQALNDADNPVLGARGLEMMAQAAAGTEPNKAAADAMIASGLAERGADGLFRLSSDGKAVLNAANRGDTHGTLEALSRLSDKQAKQSERETAQQAKDKEKADKQAEKDKQKKGGGGGGKGKASAEDKAKEKAQQREQTAQATAEKVGLEADHVEALRQAAEEGTGGIPELDELGLTKDGAATDQGRRALTALERGDVRGYRAAVQDAASRMEREKAAAQRKKDAEWRRYNQTTRRNERIAAARAKQQAKKQATKDMAMSDQLDTLIDLVEQLVDTDAAIKAGKRNSGDDQALIDRGYDLAEQLCDLFTQLGATGGEDDEAAEMGADDEQDMDLEGKAIAKREDVNPKEGLSEYGNVTFADAKNKRYPIDTEAHIRAAWNYIGQAKNAAKYEAAEVATIKRKIIAAWKDKIDDAGPPSAEVKKDAEEILAELDVVAVAHGDTIKALDGNRIGAYAVRFGSETEPDMSQMRDYFTKATDFWLDAWDRRPMLYHHAMDEDTLDAPRIGTWTKAEVKDEGVWLEGQLDRSHRYHTAIKEMIRRGVLRLSSDSAPHLVRRAMKSGGVHEVTRWPLLAASLTPTPAEPRLNAVSFKAFCAELGIDDISDQEANDTADRERSDATKADADRARRLALELQLLALETVV